MPIYNALPLLQMCQEGTTFKQSTPRNRKQAMPITHVIYWPENTAREFVPPPNHVIISIANPGRTVPLKAGWAEVLRYAFTDTEYDHKSLKFAGIDWWIATGAFAPEQAISLRANLARLQRTTNEITLVVHCLVGESRSAAIAQFVAETHGAVLEQGNSPYANQTVLTLLRDPWCYMPATNYYTLIGKPIKSLVARLRKIARRSTDVATQPENARL